MVERMRETAAMALHEWTVASALIERDGHLLLVRNVRNGGGEDWSTPGGVIDADDESIIAGLAREVVEKNEESAALMKQAIRKGTIAEV